MPFFKNGYLEFNCSFIGDSIGKKLIKYTGSGIEKINLESIYPNQTMLEDFIQCEKDGIKSRLDINYAINALNIALDINDKIKLNK